MNVSAKMNKSDLSSKNNVQSGKDINLTEHLHLKGLHGSASQFIIAAVHSHPSLAHNNHLVVLRDAEEAADDIARDCLLTG